MLEWFVLRTAFQREQRACLELSHQSIRTFLPLARTEHRRLDGLLVAKLRPLFTGYAFVFMDWLHRYPVLSTVGVKGFVGYIDGMPKPPSVSREDIKELRQRLEEIGGRAVVNLSRLKPIEPGMMAQILFGPYRDHIAKVQAVDGSRVMVLLKFAGVDVPTRLPKDCLIAAT